MTSLLPSGEKGMIDTTLVDTWLFDLDDTLYPAETELMHLIRKRITGFVMRVTGLPHDEARAVQRGWFERHGAALPGLLAEHNISVQEFLDEVHDVPLDAIAPDEALGGVLDRLPGRKLVFTNGSSGHAERVLDRLGIADRFEAIFHIESAGLIPKPAPETFARVVEVFAFEPTRAVFFDDAERNLKTGADLGMTTVLVGPHAVASTAPFVHHRTPRLTPFLTSLPLPELA